MPHEHILLLHTLHRHEAPGRSTHRLTDGFRIVGVVLVPLHVGLDELRADQPRIMPQLDQLPRPVMRPGAGFQADLANRQIG